MRFMIRLLAGIWLSTTLVVGAFAYVSVERERLTNDLQRRAWLLGEGLKEAVEPLLANAPVARIERILKKFASPNRGVAVYDRFAGLLVATKELAPSLPASPTFVAEAMTSRAARSGVQPLGGRDTYYYAVPLGEADRPIGALVIFLDASHIERQVSELVRYTALRSLALGAALSPPDRGGRGRGPVAALFPRLTVEHR